MAGLSGSVTSFIQTSAVLLIMACLFTVTGYLVAGIQGVLLFAAAGFTFVYTASRINPLVVLRIYGAQRFDPRTERYILSLMAQPAQAAGIDVPPRVYMIPSETMNAFSLGNKKRPVIALTRGITGALTEREIRAVLAHELAHIARGDLSFMRMADMMRILTDLFSIVAQFVLLLYTAAMVLTGKAVSALSAALLLILVIMPYLNLALRGLLSRTREYSADLFAARITGDPLAMASALERIERKSVSPWSLLWIPSRRRAEGMLFRSHPPTERRIRRLAAMAGRGPEPGEHSGLR